MKMFLYFDSLGCVEHKAFEKDGELYVQRSIDNRIFPKTPFPLADEPELRDSEEAAFAVWVAKQIKLQKDSILEAQKQLESEQQKLKKLIKDSQKIMDEYPEEFL